MICFQLKYEVFFALLTLALNNKVMNIFMALFTMHYAIYIYIYIYIANVTTQKFIIVTI